MSRWIKVLQRGRAFLHLSHRERSTPVSASGEGLQSSRFTNPLTPTLSPQGRGGALCSRRGLGLIAIILVVLTSPTFAQSKNDQPRQYGIGRAATAAEIAGWDIDIRPDGQGAPEGRGSVKEGEKVYMGKCAFCHGEFGEGVGRWPAVAQGQGTLATPTPAKTVGSYFPYLSSVFDYTRRAMPFGDAQSLSNDELYAVVAYMLNLNDIVDDKFVLSKETWAQVKMPNRDGFFDDDRETAEKKFWNDRPCMTNCRSPARITGRAGNVDVTPDKQNPSGESK